MSQILSTNLGAYIWRSLEKLYLDAETADVNFIFDTDDGQREIVPAHKNILASRSDVFWVMFYGKLKEKGDITMVDVSAGAFKTFLQFFYLNEVELSVEGTRDVMYLGLKYHVPECLTVCCNKYLHESPTVDNLCFVYDLAILFDRKELKTLCENEIIANTSAVLNSPSFLECDKKVLDHILELNRLSCAELDVFEACISWVKAASKSDQLTREVMNVHFGDLFQKIRFGSMTMDECLKLSQKYWSLFSADEYRQLMEAKCGANESQTQLVNMTTRQVQWNKETAIECVRSLSIFKDIFKIRDTQNATFSSNKPILFGEFVYPAIRHYREDRFQAAQSDLPAEMRIIEHADVDDFEHPQNKTLLAINIRVRSDDDTTITLSPPIFIRPEYFYTIQMKFEQNVHCCVNIELKQEVRIDEQILIKFYGEIKKYSDERVNFIEVFRFHRV